MIDAATKTVKNKLLSFKKDQKYLVPSSYSVFTNMLYIEHRNNLATHRAEKLFPC